MKRAQGVRICLIFRFVPAEAGRERKIGYFLCRDAGKTVGL